MTRPSRSTYTRRNFLNHSALVGLGAAAQMNTFGRLAHATSHGDYKALVCILLAGGADSFNMLVPYDSTRYNAYAGFRSDLALPRADLLPLAYAGPGGEAYATHPGMAGVRTLFDQGDLAFIANVGTLADPTDKVAYEAGTVRLPLGLFSHADQIAQWQTSVPDRRIATGVAGRMGDVMTGPATAPIALNVSTSGTNLFQTGASVTNYSLDAQDGVRLVPGYGGTDSAVFTDALDALLAAGYGDPFRRTYSHKFRTSIDSGLTLKAALDAAPILTTTFGGGPLAASLAQIARVISVRDTLGLDRQTFFATVGGWDHHDDVIPLQAQMLPGISSALAQFNQALTELGVAEAVTTFTISDFGRTLTSNGKGSDHGWGGHQLVMGGAVAGGQIYGAYPSLQPGNALDVGRGRYIPTTSVDELYAELALWFGIAPTDLELVLPNVRRFYATQSGVAPIGFMT